MRRRRRKNTHTHTQTQRHCKWQNWKCTHLLQINACSSVSISLCVGCSQTVGTKQGAGLWVPRHRLGRDKAMCMAGLCPVQAPLQVWLSRQTWGRGRPEWKLRRGTIPQTASHAPRPAVLSYGLGLPPPCNFQKCSPSSSQPR